MKFSLNYYKIRDVAGNYAFVMPAVVLFTVFSIYPFYQMFFLSTFEWDGISPAKQFVQLGNFKDLFLYNEIYWSAMKNAGVITFLALTVQNAFALMLALCCDRDIRFGGVYRVIFYLPPVLSGIVVGLIWEWICNGQNGLFNHLLAGLGLEHLERAWLGDPKTALYTVSIIHMWKGFGWSFIILLAGLQSIPRQLYEAAKVDGANPWHVFRHVTMPLLMPVFILVSILTVLGTMQIFEIIVSTTNGGPGSHTEVPVTRILTTMIGYSEFGYACAMGITFGVILLLVSLFQIWFSKRIQSAR